MMIMSLFVFCNIIALVFGEVSKRDTPTVVMVGMFQLMSVLENTLSKLARYDQSSVFSSILTLTVSIGL